MIVPATPTVESSTAEDIAASAPADACTQLISILRCSSLTGSSVRVTLG